MKRTSFYPIGNVMEILVDSRIVGIIAVLGLFLEKLKVLRKPLRTGIVVVRMMRAWSEMGENF